MITNLNAKDEVQQLTFFSGVVPNGISYECIKLMCRVMSSPTAVQCRA
jgi:hypothetical protein